MRRAYELFSQAAATYRRVGLTTVAAGIAPYQAMWIQYALGNARSALATLEETLQHGRRPSATVGVPAELSR